MLEYIPTAVALESTKVAIAETFDVDTKVAFTEEFEASLTVFAKFQSPPVTLITRFPVAAIVLAVNDTI